MKDPRFSGLGGGQHRLDHLRHELADAELALLPPDELVGRALVVAKRAITKKKQRDSAAAARTKKEAKSKKAAILKARAELAVAGKWTRNSAGKLAREFDVNAQYVRRLVREAKN